VGKPADVHLTDRPRNGVSTAPRTTPDHLAVIRPPAAARLTARRGLRAVRLAPCANAWCEEGRRLFSERPLRRIEPSDTSLDRPAFQGCRSIPFFESGEPRSGRRHVNVTSFSEPEVPSTGGEQAGALAIARSFLRCPAGQQGQPPHVIIDVRERRPDLSPARFHGWDRGRVRSFGFCRWLSPRARPRSARAPRPPGMRSGRLPLFLSSCLDRGQSPDELEVRGRGTPFLGAPRRDCSPRRLRPDPGHVQMPPVAAIPLSPCPE